MYCVDKIVKKEKEEKKVLWCFMGNDYGARIGRIIKNAQFELIHFFLANQIGEGRGDDHF